MGFARSSVRWGKMIGEGSIWISVAHYFDVNYSNYKSRDDRG